jgi:hypothetical protein
MEMMTSRWSLPLPGSVVQRMIGMMLAVILAVSPVAATPASGVLKLTLHRSSYEWRSVPVDGGAFTDGGSIACH